jgi:hypothetical protein
VFRTIGANGTSRALLADFGEPIVFHRSARWRTRITFASRSTFAPGEPTQLGRAQPGEDRRHDQRPPASRRNVDERLDLALGRDVDANLDLALVPPVRLDSHRVGGVDGDQPPPLRVLPKGF